MRYEDFIADKHFKMESAGFDYKSKNDFQYDYQKAVIEWSLARGKSGAFLDTGLGKTNVELEFADAASKETKKPSLVLAPLCVSHQINREAEKFNFQSVVLRNGEKINKGINICNYEQAHKLNPADFGAIILDESSILKGLDGKLRKYLTESFKHTPYRLSASATPAPNDFMEIGTQSEFLGIMSQTEMLATFFIHDGGDTAKWRLKGHGKKKFYEWLSTWSVIMRDPSDYGFNKLSELPPLNVEQVTIESGITDGLFSAIAQTLSERINARRETIKERCEKAAEIVNNSDEQFILWCGLNSEGDMLESLIPDAVQVSGSDKDKDKIDRMLGFSDGKYRVLITKPKIAGFGMNWQHCQNMIFVGLSDSWEQYYQAVRRCWRRGQQKTVNVKIITADIEGAVVDNIKQKQDKADLMLNEMAKIAKNTFKGFEKAESGLRSYTRLVDAPKPCIDW